MSPNKTDNPFRQTRVTAPAKVLFAHLERPDTRFGEPGKYTVTLGLTKADGEKLEKGLKGLRKAAAADLNAFQTKKGKAASFKGTDIKVPAIQFKTVEDDGDRAGPPGTEYAEVSFKVPPVSANGRNNKPRVIDAKKKPVSEPVFGGSTVKVAYRVQPYPGFGGGMSLRLLGVQVLDLVTGGFDPTSAFEEEDGFESAGAAEGVEETFEDGDEGGAPEDF